MASAPRARICDLPTEILVSIFSFLPVADLAQSAAVCDQWHEIVKGFTCLWKGKAYSSTRSPTECAETRAVLRLLPSFQEAIIDSADSFVFCVSYPLTVLSVQYISVMEQEDLPRLRCECLSTRLDIAGDILSHRSTIDFGRLRRLQILPKCSLNFWAPHNYSADYIVRTSLGSFPSLRQLSICAESLSADCLDKEEGLNRLQTLDMSCPDLQNLSFLRHCSNGLEELQLVGCTGLPSRELAELRRLQNLRKLRLSHCHFEECDLAAAVVGLGNLESLRLNCCSLIHDLSILEHCGRLREVCLTNKALLNPMGLVTPEGLRLHDMLLPTALEVHSLHAAGIALTADDLSAALSRLEELGLCNVCLRYLSALCNCSQLRHVCCELAHWHDVTELLHESFHITLTGSI